MLSAAIETASRLLRGHRPQHRHRGSFDGRCDCPTDQATVPLLLQFNFIGLPPSLPLFRLACSPECPSLRVRPLANVPHARARLPHPKVAIFFRCRRAISAAAALPTNLSQHYGMLSRINYSVQLSSASQNWGSRWRM